MGRQLSVPGHNVATHGRLGPATRCEARAAEHAGMNGAQTFQRVRDVGPSSCGRL